MNARQAGPSGGFVPDQIDPLLRAFFRSNMPQPFPGLRPPPAVFAAPAPEPATRNRTSRRLGAPVLVASAALLAGACWYLSSPVPAGGPPRAEVLPENATATLPPLLKPTPVTKRQK